MIVAVPMLQMGMTRKQVRERSVKYLTSMAKDLSQFLSLLSSMAREKGLFFRCYTTSSCKNGTRERLTICVVLVRPQENLEAILLSGNMALQSLVKQSATRKGMLCSATKLENKTSADMISEINLRNIKMHKNIVG